MLLINQPNHIPFCNMISFVPLRICIRLIYANVHQLVVRTLDTHEVVIQQILTLPMLNLKCLKNKILALKMNLVLKRVLYLKELALRRNYFLD